MSDFISVIVLNYSGQEHLTTVLGSLERQSLPAEQFEIILADNASTDGSVELVKNLHPRVRIISFDQNYGFAEGNNRAAHLARGQLIAFLNNDTEADANWLAELLKAHRTHPDAILGSQAFNFWQRDLSANSAAKLLAWGIPTNVHVYKPRTELSAQLELSMYADAAGMLIDKSLFLDLGGFESEYFAYEEEKELGWKAWLLGHPSYVVPTSVYYHKGGATLGQYSNKAIGLLWRNGLRNMVKFPQAWPAMRMLLLHVLYSLGVYFLIFIPLRRWSLIGPMAAAYGRLLWDWPRLRQQRARIQRTRTTSDRQLMTQGLWLGLVASLRHSRAFLRRRRAIAPPQPS